MVLRNISKTLYLIISVSIPGFSVGTLDSISVETRIPKSDWMKSSIIFHNWVNVFQIRMVLHYKFFFSILHVKFLFFFTLNRQVGTEIF